MATKSPSFWGFSGLSAKWVGDGTPRRVPIAFRVAVAPVLPPSAYAASWPVPVLGVSDRPRFGT